MVQPALRAPDHLVHGGTHRLLGGVHRRLPRARALVVRRVLAHHYPARRGVHHRPRKMGRATLDRPDLALHSRQLVTPTGDILLERKGWYQIWIHQFLKAKVLRSLFSQLPLKISSAKALDGLKDQIPKPDEYHLFVTEQNFAVFGESTKRGVITRNCLESIRQTDIELPEWFQRSNGEWVTMGKLPEDTLWQRFRRRLTRGSCS